jgi:hypothetical protein
MLWQGRQNCGIDAGELLQADSPHHLPVRTGERSGCASDCPQGDYLQSESAAGRTLQDL